ncbi:MAG: DUF2254 domain-containing protein [Candidatus Lambdaproteobacteria bacterium]|nr:DUF2254 domain-containing protein [Candidatus Lambdaproteobacteria bacterium]
MRGIVGRKARPTGPPLAFQRAVTSNGIRPRRRALRIWLPPILVSLGVSAGLILVGRVIDFGILRQQPERVLTDWIFLQDADAAHELLLASLQVLAGIFAITITVVAIIVQLSATSYTSRVVDLFLADPLNTLIFFANVVPLCFGMWLAGVSTAENYSSVSMALYVILSTLAIVMVIPYFKYVFHFLQPRNIIDRIEHSIEITLAMAQRERANIARHRAEVTNSIRQLSDIAMSSLTHADVVLALQSLDSIKAATLFYLQRKARLPAAWFEVEASQMMGLSQEVLDDVVKNRVWLELEVFKQYELAFTTSLRKVRDINGCIARNLREIGEMAAAVDADRTVEFVIKGFNTLIMYCQSERDIRSAVTVIYQYRKLGEAVLYRPDLLEKIALHLKYYGHNSQRRRIFFILDAVAYDLRVLIELVFERFPENIDGLLRVFLELDQLAATPEDLAFLRGVRKSQALMAGFFIRQRRFDLVKRILDDMREESPEFVRSVKRDLFANTTREFWEIEDRGVSFYYVDEHNRESVEQFFSWLLGDSQPPFPLAARRHA